MPSGTNCPECGSVVADDRVGTLFAGWIEPGREKHRDWVVCPSCESVLLRPDATQPWESSPSACPACGAGVPEPRRRAQPRTECPTCGAALERRRKPAAIGGWRVRR
jgi:predicted RNA-binding Zn-ribbon protein involved in translation (DUF1610 family)